MKNINYEGKYKLEESNTKIGELSLEQAITQTMSHSANFRNYCIRKKEGDDLLVFGRNDQVLMDSNNALLMSASNEFQDEVPAIILRYGVCPKQIIIGYIQTPSDINFGNYKKIISDLGIRPHDLIFAHFLRRISPVLNKFPDTNVFFSQIYLSKPVYPFLRDRFLDRDYFLNPRRIRVQQIIGQENSWLMEKNVQERSKSQKNIKDQLFRRSGFWDLLV